MHPVFVCLIIVGAALHARAVATVAFSDTTVNIAEGSTGTLTTVNATTNATKAVVFTVAATSNALSWINVTASGSNCVVTLTSGQTIDYEDSNLVNHEYVATVTATETGETAVTFQLTLAITDVLEVTGLAATIKENRGGGALVVNVSTEDTSGTYTFAIASQIPDSGWFAITPTGAITVVDGKTVNFEDTGLKSNTYKVVVVATKSDNTKSATGTVVITIQNTDDFASGLTASVMDGKTTGTITTITTTPTDATVALVSQTGNLGWFSLTNNVISVASGKTIDKTNTQLATGSTYLIVLTVGTGATQGTGTVTIAITTSSVSAVIGNVISILGLLLASKLVVKTS